MATGVVVEDGVVGVVVVVGVVAWVVAEAVVAGAAPSSLDEQAVAAMRRPAMVTVTATRRTRDEWERLGFLELVMMRRYENAPLLVIGP